METDEGGSAAIATGLLEQLEGLRKDEKERVFIAIRDGLEKDDRFLLRTTFGVPAAEELTADMAAAKVSEELKALTKAMAAEAKRSGRDGVVGVARFVTDGAVLTDVDWNKDVEKKCSVAPTFMAMLGAALQTESWHCDNKRMSAFLEAAEGEIAAGRAKVVGGRLLRLTVGGEGGEEDEVFCKSHSKRRLSFATVESELGRRKGSFVAALAAFSDACVASRNRGQEITTPYLLSLSTLCAQALVRPVYELLSSVKFLLPLATAAAALDEAGRMYEAAFVTDMKDMAVETGTSEEFHDAMTGGGDEDDGLLKMSGAGRACGRRSSSAARRSILV